MKACPRHEEDLALLAGGDLSPRDRVSEVLDHVRSCMGCADLLEALQGDQRTIAVAARFAEPRTVAASGLTESVMLALSGEPMVGPSPAIEAAREPRWSRSGAWSRVGGAVAATVLVGSLVVMGMFAMSASSPGIGPVDAGTLPGPVASTAVQSEDALYRPVWLKRVAGDGVELTWSGDGREDGSGAGSTYRVLASASARDFSSAKPVEVAGNHLVATMALPAQASADRKVTYFRVQ